MQIGVPFDETIVASEVGSYKPALGHWQRVRARRSAGCRTSTSLRATSTTSCPASDLGLPTVWVNRLAEHGDPPPTREIPRPRAAARTCSTSSSPRDAARVPPARPRRTRRRSPTSATRSSARSRREPEIVSADDILRCSGAARARRGSSYDGDTLVGTAYLQRRGDRWDGDGYVHPDAFGRGVGTAIVEWIETRARELGSPETRIGILRAGRAGRVPAPEPRVRADPELLPDGDRARRRARPAGVAGRLRGRARSRPARSATSTRSSRTRSSTTGATAPRTFEEWLATHASSSTSSASSSARAASRCGGQRSASASCFGMGWVDVLGTRREYRRKGLGEALLAPRLPRALPRAARARSGSASTPRTRPARPGSTSASACASPPSRTSTPRPCR